MIKNNEMIRFHLGFENRVRKSQREKNEQNPSSNGEKKPRNHKEASQRIKKEIILPASQDLKQTILFQESHFEIPSRKNNQPKEMKENQVGTRTP